MKVQWQYCKEAEREHEQSERQYAHTYHYANTICVCRAFWNLPKDFRDGILLHEIGHLLVGPEGSEMDATRAAEEFFDVPIRYVDSPYGRELERVSNMARRTRRRKNPEEELPFNEWIPADAVMFNDDGTVSVMTEPGETLSNGGRRRNAAVLPLDKGRVLIRLPSGSPSDEAEQLAEEYFGGPVRLHDLSFDDITDSTRYTFEKKLANRGRRRNQEFYSYYPRWVPQRLMPDLMNLYHTSRMIVGTTPSAKYGASVERQSWTASEFHKEHPEIKHGYIYKDLQGALGY